MKKIMFLVLLLIPTLTEANYIESANYLAEKGIIVNQSENPEKYNLGKNILRQEIAGIIAKMSGVPEKTTCENKFLDVKITANNSWACPRIESLLDAGIIAHNKKYNPESFVTKAESLGFILKGLFREEYAEYSEKNKNNSWELNAGNFAIEKGILTENVEDLNEKASRGFIFQIMKNALNTPEHKEVIIKIENVEFKKVITELNSKEGILKNDLLKEVNSYRKENNLSELKISEKLNIAAQKYAEEMVKGNFFEHVTADGRTPKNRVIETGYDPERVLENIARGQENAKNVIEAWKKSPGHNINLLDSESDEIGIGYYKEYWVVNIGKEFK